MEYIVIPIALLLGVAAFVVLLTVIKGGYFATKRRKTKLGLVKVAGAGLKLGGGDEADGSDGGPDGAEEAAAADAGADAGGGLDDTADGIVAAGDKAASVGEDDESRDTFSVPLETIKGESGSETEAAPPSKQSSGADKRGDADTAGDTSGEDKRFGGSGVRPVMNRPFGEKLHVTETRPVVRKIVNPPVENPFDNLKSSSFSETKPVVKKIADPPVENPFIGGKSPAGDGSAKKTTVVKRKRLPETVKMKDRKVILAEDVAINRDLIAMYFDGSGVKFEFAVNGREVCEKFEREPNAYSLILMDIQMPEMDGYEVSRRIRSMDVDWAKQIPIIAMTGNDQKEDIDLCFEAGMDDHIPKPIDMEVLQEKVFDILTLNAESF